MENIIVQHPEWSKNATIYEVNLRHYTQSGTLLEFEQHLPRLKDLGIDILWFMPIQPIGEKNRKGTLGSPYSIKDYTSVNPYFGTINDFKRVVDKIHEMGMYVLLDWVANHTAWDNWWIEKFPHFYKKDEQGEFMPPNPDWSDVLQLDYSCDELYVAMIDSMKFWITECNVDGFRCDMAHLVTTDFWLKAREELDKVKPVFMLAETEDKELLQAFDMIYNWKIYHLLNDIAAKRMYVSDLDVLLKEEVLDFPSESYQMLFTSNHDENTWNGSAIERLTFGLEACIVLTYTLDGMPLIYTGQEAGNYRRLHFFDKDVIDWRFDKLFPLYQRLNLLKKTNKALWNGEYGGEFSRIHTDLDRIIFAYSRKKEEEEVVTIINFSSNNVDFKLLYNNSIGNFRNVISYETESLSMFSYFCLKPWEYKVLERI